MFFLSVSNRLIPATSCEWIGLSRAMTDSAKIDSAAYAKTAAVVVTMMIVMFPAAFTTAAASAGRTFAGAARTTCRFARRAGG